MTKKLLFGVFALILATGCRTTKTEYTQLQIRQFQTREYQMSDTLMVMKAVVSTLQDEGFIIKNADKDLGLVVAFKEAEVKHIIDGILSTLGGLAGSQETWDKKSDVECSANVRQFGNEVRVRVNFKLKLKNIVGGAVKVREVHDPEYYQAFFSKIDKGIFIEKEGI